MTETQQRFLRAIAERVPSAHVVEVHLFPPMRQGGMETGVAVVAEDPRRPAPNVMEPVQNGAELASDVVQADGALEVEPVDETLADASLSEADVVEEAAAESWVGELVEALAEVSEDATPGDDEDATLADDSDSPYREETAVEVEPVDQADGAGEVAATLAPRYTIHTARYRLTLKGVDRGKWDFDVVAEADASLEALDKVVRGVLRRSGEGAEPDRLTAETFREALEAPLATLER
jgi:hypothetical protein